MPAPTITPLPTPPSRSQSPETFSTDADAFLGALPDFATDANAQAAYLDGLATAVDADATTASNAAAVAAGAANYMGDYSAGTTYQIGESVSYNGRRYVAKTVNTGVTPADGANWFLINDGDVLGPASATNNALVLFDGTTGKLLKNGVGNGTLGALLASGGSGAAPSYLGQGTSGQVLISGGSGNLPTWGDFSSENTKNFTSSGSIVSGDLVAVNSNGTVSKIGLTNVAPTFGAASVVHNGGSTTTLAIAYDPVSQVIMYAYRDGSNNPYTLHFRFAKIIGDVFVNLTQELELEYANGNNAFITYHKTRQCFVVGWTNSSAQEAYVQAFKWLSDANTYISWPKTLVSGNNPNGLAMCYDSVSDKIIMSFNDQTGSPAGGYVAVIDIFASSISVGTKVAFNPSFSVTAYSMSLAPDPVNQKVLLTYRDGNGAGGTAVVLTISGMSVSVGSKYVFSTATVGNTSATYDPNSGNILIVFRDGAGSNYLSARVATISGTTVSFGTRVSAATVVTNLMATQYDEITGKHLLVYQYDGTLRWLAYRLITVSGTTVSSIGTEEFIETNATTELQQRSLTPVNNTYNFAVVYADETNSFYAELRNINTGWTSNLTKDNWIGVSAATVSTGQTVSIKLIGAIDASKTGLTAGRKYYVNYDGKYSLFSNSLNVLAGTAISATSLIIKG